MAVLRPVVLFMQKICYASANFQTYEFTVFSYCVYYVLNIVKMCLSIDFRNYYLPLFKALSPTEYFKIIQNNNPSLKST